MSFAAVSFRYARKNTAGEIDLLILKDLTGDMLSYGILTDSQEQELPSLTGFHSLMGTYGEGGDHPTDRGGHLVGREHGGYRAGAAQPEGGQLDLYHSQGLDEGITLTREDMMTRQDALLLFYNLLTGPGSGRTPWKSMPTESEGEPTSRARPKKSPW